MRWIDRGPEPENLLGYRLNCTQDWIDYFDRNRGEEPAPHWGRFRSELGQRFGDKCGYCERLCESEQVESNRAPTVDHFKPRSQFPELTYEWTNWVFSCRQCNVDNKQDKWFQDGYVDPCAADPALRPERYFDYDAKTGQVVPKSDLGHAEHQRAVRTINDLGLNEMNVMFDRYYWMCDVQYFLTNLPMSERPAMIEYYTSQSMVFSGITKIFLSSNSF